MFVDLQSEEYIHWQLRVSMVHHTLVHMMNRTETNKLYKGHTYIIICMYVCPLQLLLHCKNVNSTSAIFDLAWEHCKKSWVDLT